jgi:hypothetical protein
MPNKEINRFKKDLKSFGLSAAGNLPRIGPALGLYDTYQKGKRLAKSGGKMLSNLERRYLG